MLYYHHHHFVDESIHGHPHHQGLAHQPNSLDDLDNDTIPFDNVPVRYDDSGKDDCTLVKKNFFHDFFFAKSKTFPIRFYRSRTLWWYESSQPRLASVQWSVQDVNYDNFIIITRYQDIWRSYHPIINLLNMYQYEKINDVIFEKSWVFEDSDF